MTTRAAHLPIVLTIAALLLALYGADACQAQRRAGLDLPAAVAPVAGNAEARALLAQWPVADAATRARISARLCVIGRGMYWQDVGPELARFLREEGCY